MRLPDARPACKVRPAAAEDASTSLGLAAQDLRMALLDRHAGCVSQ